jgi:DNA-binding NarL/FixJ family response regulator
MRQNGLKVLIVEDSPLILERMTSILSDLDCISELQNSCNGLDVIDKVAQQQPDVLLLDINLPGKSGLSILKEIKRNKYSTTVVMLTNYSDQYYRNLCADLGAEYFLDKSTEFEKIPLLLSNIFGCVE